MISVLDSKRDKRKPYAKRIKLCSGWQFNIPRQPMPAVDRWCVRTSENCEEVQIYRDGVCVAHEQFRIMILRDPNDVDFVFMDAEQNMHIHSSKYKLIYSICDDSWIIVRSCVAAPAKVSEKQWGLNENKNPNTQQ
jgi:hypothetical protein